VTIDGSTTAPEWVFDLVSPEADRRRAALDRHRTTLEDSHEAQRWINRVWEQAGTPAPQEAYLAAQMDQARAAKRDADALTFFAPISAWSADWSIDVSRHAQYAPYAVLFLEWEARYPLEWRGASTWSWSPWGTKEGILARFIRGGVPVNSRQFIADLVIAAITREYRCKDWMYAPLARAVDGPDLRHGLCRLLDGDDPLVRLRAAFVLHILDHPELRVRRHTWQRWLAVDDGRH
jgi:hypothetical protein